MPECTKVGLKELVFNIENEPLVSSFFMKTERPYKSTFLRDPKNMLSELIFQLLLHLYLQMDLLIFCYKITFKFKRDIRPYHYDLKMK